MKYCYMSFSTPELNLPDMLDLAKRYGYDGIEPRMDAGHKHGVEIDASRAQRVTARQQAHEAGVGLACLATSLRYADPETKDATVDATHARIDLAGDCGIPAMRVFGGKLADGLGRDEAIQLVADSLRLVADHAAERGVTLCLETHDDWCDPRHVAAVLGAVNHPNVGANWDIMHPVRTGLATMDEAFDALRPWIRHLHVHDGTGSGGELCPIGEGIVDHRRAIELLKSVDFDGFISGEWIKWEPYEQHLPRELATLRRYEAELA
jgi:sugar phosphate isomerase/epimerase